MNTQIQTALFQAAVLTFEDLGLMLASSEIDEQQSSAQATMAMGVEFKGPCSGTLIVVGCGEVPQSIASNMLGDQVAPPANLQRDALGEVANVMCGNLLPRIAGSRAVFEIGPPHAREIPPGEPSEFTATTSVGVDEGRADIFLLINENANEIELKP